MHIDLRMKVCYNQIMPEGQPGFFRRAIDRITGKAAQQARIAEEQRQEVAAREAEDRARYSEDQQVINIAIQRPASVLGPEFNPTQEIARIAGNIQAIEARAQVHAGVTINGKTLWYRDTRGDETAIMGEADKISRHEGWQRYTAIAERIRIAVDPLIGHYKSDCGFGPDFLTAVNLPDNNHAVLSYIFWNYFQDQNTRIGGNGIIQFLLPKEDAFAALEVVRKNPDSLNEFMQKGASGFLETAHVKPSQTISIINLDRFDPNTLNPWQKTEPGRHVSYYIWQSIKDCTNGVRETYKYTNPRQK